MERFPAKTVGIERATETTHERNRSRMREDSAWGSRVLPRTTKSLAVQTQIRSRWFGGSGAPSRYGRGHAVSTKSALELLRGSVRCRPWRIGRGFAVPVNSAANLRLCLLRDEDDGKEPRVPPGEACLWGTFRRVAKVCKLCAARVRGTGAVLICPRAGSDHLFRDYEKRNCA